jgi:hypothetical protein
MCLDSVIRVLEAEKLTLIYTLSGFMCRGANACLKCAWSPDGTHFTCFTSAKVQMLRQKAGRAVCGVRQRGWTVGRVAGARERERGVSCGRCSSLKPNQGNNQTTPAY